MSRRRIPRTSRRRRRRSHHWPRLKAFRRFTRRRLHEIRTFLRAVSKTHPGAQILIGAALLLVLFMAMNWIYHAMAKPTEIFFPLDRSLDKSLTETWREYGPLFQEHATEVITPELLAALAQTEGNGNPVARTYWRRQWSRNPFEWYQPASSGVGMFQITDGTFRIAKRYCIHDHQVVEVGPWYDLNSCWFNSLYARVIPSHAIEMTAALLDRNVAQVMDERRQATLRDKQHLAAVIHLCGAGTGRAFALRSFRLRPHQRCGDHDVRTYLTRVDLLKRRFAALNTAG